jgi:hypothetical protein
MDGANQPTICLQESSAKVSRVDGGGHEKSLHLSGITRPSSCTMSAVFLRAWTGRPLIKWWGKKIQKWTEGNGAANCSLNMKKERNRTGKNKSAGRVEEQRNHCWVVSILQRQTPEGAADGFDWQVKARENKYSGMDKHFSQQIHPRYSLVYLLEEEKSPRQWQDRRPQCFIFKQHQQQKICFYYQ